MRTQRFQTHTYATYVSTIFIQDEERDRITYRGWDSSKDFLEQVVKEQGPFDGVMGFSQVPAQSCCLSSSLHHTPGVPTYISQICIICTLGTDASARLKCVSQACGLCTSRSARLCHMPTVYKLEQHKH